LMKQDRAEDCGNETWRQAEPCGHQAFRRTLGTGQKAWSRNVRNWRLYGKHSLEDHWLMLRRTKHGLLGNEASVNSKRYITLWLKQHTLNQPTEST
jgi:hypothetical protein